DWSSDVCSSDLSASACSRSSSCSSGGSGSTWWRSCWAAASRDCFALSWHDKERAMKWITREHVKVDRVACPWLIRKFVDPQAEFLFVPGDQVAAVARREGATTYDC